MGAGTQPRLTSSRRWLFKRTLDAGCYGRAAKLAFYLHTADAVEAQDPTLSRALCRIAKDETRHYAFYRDVVKAHLDADAAYVIPLVGVLVQFQMPGRVMSDFEERSLMLASEGVFGPEQYLDDVVDVVCAFWGVDELAAAVPEARRTVARLRALRAGLKRLAKRLGGSARQLSKTG